MISLETYLIFSRKERKIYGVIPKGCIFWKNLRINPAISKHWKYTQNIHLFKCTLCYRYTLGI